MTGWVWVVTFFVGIDKLLSTFWSALWVFFYQDYLVGADHLIDDEVLHQALESLEGAALKFSADVISDAKQRDNYNQNVKRVKGEVLAQVKAGSISVKDAAEFCYEARNKIMAEVRAKTSVHGLAVAEARKKVSPSLEKLLDEKSISKFGEKFAALDTKRKKVMHYEIVESSARPDATFNTMNKVLRVSGKVLIVVTIAYASYEIANAENKYKEAIKQGGSNGRRIRRNCFCGHDSICCVWSRSTDLYYRINVGCRNSSRVGGLASHRIL